MQVTAFATPKNPEWRWRIVSSAGDIVEESHDSFPTIAAAVARGKERLTALDVVDRSVPPSPRRSTSHLRFR